MKKDSACLLPFAAFGLMLSRIVDVIVMIVFYFVTVPLIAQLLVSTAVYSVLLVLFVYYMLNKSPKIESVVEESEESILARFAKKYNLTAREAEILECIKEGLSDNEIAEKYFISKSTVRFHISNLLKKTESSSRVDAVRKMQTER